MAAATISTTEDEEGEEEGTEGVKYKEAGQMVEITAIIKMEEEEGTVEAATMVGNRGKEGQGMLEEDTKVKDTKVEGVIKGKDTKVEGIKEGIKGKDTKVEGIKEVTKGRDTLVEVTKEGKKAVTKATTRMVVDNRSEEGAGGVVVEEDGEDEVGKAEAGVVEGGRILTKEGNLSSFSNMVGISITRRGSGMGFTPAELARDHQKIILITRIESRSQTDAFKVFLRTRLVI